MQRSDFIALIHALFPEPEPWGVAVRPLDLPGGAAVTVAHITALMEPGDLERLVLQPLAQGLPASASAAAPADLARSGHFPAPRLEVAGDSPALQAGLLAGLAAVHVEGQAGTLLVGSGRLASRGSSLGPDLDANLALLRRHLRRADLRLHALRWSHGVNVVAYLAGVAQPRLVQAVRFWAWSRGPLPPATPWLHALLEVLRLPKAVETTSPAAVADALQRGYVAVLAGHLPHALLAPATLELLLSGPQDTVLPQALRRLVTWPRLIACAVALSLGAAFVAVASYHHSLLPGAFLIALAATRQNLPFPVVLEVFQIQLVDDAMWAGALRWGGQMWGRVATIGTVLAAMAALQAGVIAPLSAMIGIAGAVALQVLPGPDLVRRLRVWRYPLLVAATGLGLYGLTLLAFGLMAYLAEERPFGHPLRRPPEAGQAGPS